MFANPYDPWSTTPLLIVAFVITLAFALVYTRKAILHGSNKMAAVATVAALVAASWLLVDKINVDESWEDYVNYSTPFNGPQPASFIALVVILAGAFSLGVMGNNRVAQVLLAMTAIFGCVAVFGDLYLYWLLANDGLGDWPALVQSWGWFGLLISAPCAIMAVIAGKVRQPGRERLTV